MLNDFEDFCSSGIWLLTITYYCFSKQMCIMISFSPVLLIHLSLHKISALYGNFCVFLHLFLSCLYVCLFICMFFVFVCLYVFLYLFVCMVFALVCLFFSLFVCFLYLFVSMFLYLFVRFFSLSVCLFVCLFVCWLTLQFGRTLILELRWLLIFCCSCDSPRQSTRSRPRCWRRPASRNRCPSWRVGQISETRASELRRFFVILCRPENKKTIKIK